MPTFQDLANEIIIQIIQSCKPTGLRGFRIAQDTLCSLRLVSRHIDTLVCPILFATLRLEFWDSDGYFRDKDRLRCREIIIALTTRSTTVFEHTTKLVMRTEKLFWTHDSRSSSIAQMKRFLNERISDIISALKNLQSIEYSYSPVYDPPEFPVNLIHTLATLPSFKSMILHFIESQSWQIHIPQTFTLQPLSNLTVFQSCWGQSKSKTFPLEIASLLVRCPNMINLELDQVNGNGVTLHQIFRDLDKMEMEWRLERLVLKGVVVGFEDIEKHIRHFRNLSFLEILFNDHLLASTTFGQICRVLQENAIFLKGVVTDHPEDFLLLHYLSSYSGLTNLHFHCISENDPISSEILNQVYTLILPNHINTIESLKMGYKELESRVGGEIRLPKREHLVQLGKCRKLKVVEVHLKICWDELRRGCEDDSEEGGGGLDGYMDSLKNVKSSFEMMLNRIRRLGV